MAARRETVWINAGIRQTPEFDALSASALRLWVRLPFLVDDQQRAPELALIASDGRIGRDEAARLMSELAALMRLLRPPVSRFEPVTETITERLFAEQVDESRSGDTFVEGYPVAGHLSVSRWSQAT